VACGQVVRHAVSGGQRPRRSSRGHGCPLSRRTGATGGTVRCRVLETGHGAALAAVDTASACASGCRSGVARHGRAHLARDRQQRASTRGLPQVGLAAPGDGDDTSTHLVPVNARLRPIDAGQAPPGSARHGDASVDEDRSGAYGVHDSAAPARCCSSSVIARTTCGSASSGYSQYDAVRAQSGWTPTSSIDTPSGGR